MEKKFELTNEKINFFGHKLYRIRALKDFSIVKKGDLGGFVEKEKNLSQKGDCWVHNNAKVCDNAIVSGNALVCNNALIYDNAEIHDDTIISENAKVCGNAKISDKVIINSYATVGNNAKVYRMAQISGHAQVFDNAQVYGGAIVCSCARVSGDAQVYGIAMIADSAEVCGNAKVFGNAKIYGTAQVYGNAVVKESQFIKIGNCTVDLSKNLKENIRCQTNLFPQKDSVIAYKQVNKNLTSFYDSKFQYKIGEWVEVEDPDMSTTIGCSSGLHFSNVNYWDLNAGPCATYLMAKIMYDDIIAVQSGKIRCKKAFIIDRYDIENN